MKKWIKKSFAIILMLGMVAGLSLQYLSFESKAVEQATPEDLGFERVVLEDFGIEDDTYYADVANGALAKVVTGTYKENSLDKKYLDVDVSFAAAENDADTSIRYGNGNGDNGLQIYILNGKLGIWATPENEYYEYTPEQIGLTSITDTFNIKLGVDFGEGYKGTESVNCSAKVYLWINNKLIEDGKVFNTVYSTGNQLSIWSKNRDLTVSTPSNTPAEPATPEDLGFERVVLADFGAPEQRWETNADGNAYSWFYYVNGESLDMKYLDVDLSFEMIEGQDYGTSLRYANGDGWGGIQIGATAEGKLRVGDANGEQITYECKDIGIETVTKPFNLKLAIDFGDGYKGTENVDCDASYWLWINDVLVDQVNLTPMKSTGYKITFYRPNGNFTATIPVKQVAPGDLGFKRVVLEDFNIKGGTYQKADGGAEHAAYGEFYGDSLDMTYLDVDIAFGANQGAGTSIRYGNNDGWNGIQINTTPEGKLEIGSYAQNLWKAYTPQELGIKSVADTFNLKLAVDFGDDYKGTESVTCSATISLWINDRRIIEDMHFEQVGVTGNHMSIVTEAGMIIVSTPDVVIYDSSYSIFDYWSVESKTAPIKEGYVFGGWFQEAPKGTESFERLISEDGTTTLKCVPLTPDDIKEGITAYAKFVPAQVLSVKAQNSQIKDSETDALEKIDENNVGTISQDNPMRIRVMSSVDSTNYEKIGFDIYLANKKRVTTKTGNELLETGTVYDGVLEGDAVATANDIFGGVSKYVSVWKLVDIDTPSNKDKIIYVRPYWYTMDGTKVEGLAKYVHIEDDYMNYISVPINLLDKEVAAQVAGGAVNMTYANSQGEPVAINFIEVEEGRLLPEMASNFVDNTIKMVGNAIDVDSDNKDSIGNLETLYANVRFQKPENVATDVDVDFSTFMIKFCNWEEKEIFVNEKWDVKYDVKETTGK